MYVQMINSRNLLSGYAFTRSTFTIIIIAIGTRYLVSVVNNYTADTLDPCYLNMP